MTWNHKIEATPDTRAEWLVPAAIIGFVCLIMFGCAADRFVVNQVVNWSVKEQSQ